MIIKFNKMTPRLEGNTNILLVYLLGKQESPKYFNLKNI